MGKKWGSELGMLARATWSRKKGLRDIKESFANLIFHGSEGF